MKRILFLANPGVIHAARWINATADHGYEVHVATIHSPMAKLRASVKLHVAPLRVRPAGYYLNTSWVRRLVRLLKPDVVHAHYASGYGGMAATLGFHPLFTSLWGSDIYEFPLRSRLHRNLLRFNLDSVDRVLSTSAAMANEASKYTDKPIEITPFGVDLVEFCRRRVSRPFDERAIVIGTIKSIEPTYGIHTLISAFRLVKSRHPEMPVKLLIVGGGSQSASLKRMVLDLHLEKDALFTGFVPHEEVATYQNMLDVSVTLSLRESFGVAVVEASACERPVVVSRVGGLPEVVEDGVSGYVVDGSADAAAVAIERLVLDRASAERMGRAGRDRVRAMYDWRENVERVFRLYENT